MSFLISVIYSIYFKNLNLNRSDVEMCNALETKSKEYWI